MAELSGDQLRRIIGVVLFLCVVVGAVLTTWSVLKTLSVLPRTTDAAISAETVKISAGVPGRIVEILVRENDSVAAGDLLFSLDDTALKIMRDQAQALVDVANAALDDAERVSLAGQENALSAEAEIQRAETNLELATKTVDRIAPLAEDGIASQQVLDEARTAQAGAQVSLDVAKQTARASNDLISNTASLAATLRVAQAELALAEHNISLTKVFAPVSGKVTGLIASAGAWVLPEFPLFTLIDTETWFVEGYFRETDIAEIALGQPIQVSILATPKSVVTGHVDSIGWGIQGADAITLPGQLPFIPQTTDWVRLAKRYPVRVKLEPPYLPNLRLGASAALVLLPQDNQ